MNVLNENEILLEYYKKDKEISHLFHGMNDTILKPYTTNGFIKSVKMWEQYSHESFEAFLNDFLKMYPEEYLKENCTKCYNKLKEKYPKQSEKITFENLYDKLFYKLVVDCYIGHACENKIFNYLNEYFKEQNTGLKAIYDYKMDTKYGIDIIIVDKDNNIKSLIQVKNKTFFIISNYNDFKIRDQVKKEQLFRKDHEEYKDLPIFYYIYDKDSFFDTGKFFLYKNTLRENYECKFLLSDFIDQETGTILQKNFFTNNKTGMFL